MSNGHVNLSSRFPAGTGQSHLYLLLKDFSINCYSICFPFNLWFLETEIKTHFLIKNLIISEQILDHKYFEKKIIQFNHFAHYRYFSCRSKIYLQKYKVFNFSQNNFMYTICTVSMWHKLLVENNYGKVWQHNYSKIY